MDHSTRRFFGVTKQFLSLARKLKKELRNGLNDLQKALQKQTEAAKKASEAQQEQTAAQQLVLAELENHSPRERHAERNEESRHPMQWIKLAIEIAMLFIVAAYAAVSAFQLVQMKNAADAAKSAAETAANQLELTERPWIKITDVQTRSNNPIIPALSFQKPPQWPSGTQQATFQLDISYKNVGRSVAKVSVDFKLFLPLWKDGYSNVILATEKSFCDSVSRINPDPNLQVINFPGDDPYHWYGGGAAIVNAETTNYFSDIRPGVGHILPVVAVCVNYQFGESPKVYQTRALFEVFRKDNRTRFFEIGRGVPAHDIFLQRNASGDAAY